MPNIPESFCSLWGRLSGRTRAQAILALFCLIFMPLAFAGLFYIKEVQTESRIDLSRKTFEVVQASAQYYHSLAAAGRMSDEAAKQVAAGVLGRMAYRRVGEAVGCDGDESLNPQFVSFPIISPNQIAPQHFISSLDPEHSSPHTKLCYVSELAPWGWTISTSFCIDDIITSFWNNFSFLISLFAALMAMGSMLIDWMYKKVEE